MSNKPPNPLYVPDVFKDGDAAFLMSATHRGDMYHLRAALQVKKFSVVLYNSNPDTKGLEDYLTHSVLKNGNNIFIVPWEYDNSKDKDDSIGKDESKGKNYLKGNNGVAPKGFAGCFLNGKEYTATGISKRKLKTYSESEATKFISGLPDPLQNIGAGMADIGQISDGFEKKLLAAFTEIWKNAGIKRPEPHEPKNPAILFLYRDTGTSDAMGVYPELDTGNAIKEIRDIVDKFPKHGNDKLQIISCGLKVAPQNASSPKGELGIGEYWKHIPKLPHGEKSSARDVEAYFLDWSYKQGYYRMASGFRSGALDLFTFMGIPSVSIELRNLKGDIRHRRLADGKFKRVNIQYDQPRHNTTACIFPQYNNPIVYASPFWGDEKPFDPPDKEVARVTPSTHQGKKDQQTKAPEAFHKFDKRVIEIGYRFACQQYMDLSKSVFKLVLKSKVPGAPEDDKVTHVDTRFARSCYISGEDKGLDNHLKAIKVLDLGDVKAMGSKLGKPAVTLQQTAAIFKIYENEFNEDWKEIEERPKTAAVPTRRR
jgi:hypothetical protein